MNAELSLCPGLAECRHLTEAQSCHPRSRRALAPGPATFSCSDELRDRGRWQCWTGTGLRCLEQSCMPLQNSISGLPWSGRSARGLVFLTLSLRLTRSMDRDTYHYTLMLIKAAYLIKIQWKQYYCEILLQFNCSTGFYLNIFLKCNLFLWCKAVFSALLQSSVSHDPSEIILICWFAAQDTFLIIINV